MLPERLSFSLAIFATIALICIGLLHHWDWETTMIMVLTGVLLSMIVGRFAGRISGKELSKNVEEIPHDEDDDDKKSQKA